MFFVLYLQVRWDTRRPRSWTREGESMSMCLVLPGQGHWSECDLKASFPRLVPSVYTCPLGVHVHIFVSGLTSQQAGGRWGAACGFLSSYKQKVK